MIRLAGKWAKTQTLVSWAIPEALFLLGQSDCFFTWLQNSSVCWVAMSVLMLSTEEAVLCWFKLPCAVRPMARPGKPNSPFCVGNHCTVLVRDLFGVHRITEFPMLEGTYKYHWVQLLEFHTLSFWFHQATLNLIFHLSLLSLWARFGVCPSC